MRLVLLIDSSSRLEVCVLPDSVYHRRRWICRLLSTKFTVAMSIVHTVAVAIARCNLQPLGPLGSLGLLGALGAFVALPLGGPLGILGALRRLRALGILRFLFTSIPLRLP